MDQPLATDRLTMRPFTPGDVDALHAIWADPEVGPWVGGTHTDIAESIEELEEHLRHQKRYGFGFWAVEETVTGRVIGEVGLMLFEGRGPEVEIGWCIASDLWGRGYAGEAASAWLGVGFRDLALDRVLAVVLPTNERSRRVCARVGMRETGTRLAYGAEHVQYEAVSPLELAPPAGG